MSNPAMEFDATLTCGVRIHATQHEPGQNLEVEVTPREGTTLNETMVYSPDKLRILMQPEVVIGINSITDALLGVSRRVKRLVRMGTAIGFFVGVLAGLLLASGISWYLLHFNL